MKKLWIQYIVLILSAGIMLASFPLFTDQIELADADVEWQNDAYINEFGDEVIPLPDMDLISDISELTSSSALSSEASGSEISSFLLSSSGTSLFTSSLSGGILDPTVSTLPIPSVISSKPVSSNPPASSATATASTSTSSVQTSSKPASSATATSAPVSSKPTVTSAPTSSAPGTITTEETVMIAENGKTVTYKISYILPRIVEAEIGGGSPVEAIKAQAVATHTFLRYYNDIQNSAPSVAQKTPTTAVINACNAVLDKIITINGKPVYTPYCAATAGKTNASEDVWSGKLSHLRSVISEYDSEDTTNWNRKTTMPVSDVKSKLSSKTGLSITGDPATWLTLIDRTAGGYNKNMKICGNTTYTSGGSTVKITGRVIREQILGLRSACFEWKVEGDSFIFTTKGYGHGVGLSQMGAIGYAKHGYTYDKILKHYYTGVMISTWKGSAQ